MTTALNPVTRTKTAGASRKGDTPAEAQTWQRSWAVFRAGTPLLSGLPGTMLISPFAVQICSRPNEAFGVWLMVSGPNAAAARAAACAAPNMTWETIATRASQTPNFRGGADHLCLTPAPIAPV